MPSQVGWEKKFYDHLRQAQRERYSSFLSFRRGDIRGPVYHNKNLASFYGLLFANLSIFTQSQTSPVYWSDFRPKMVYGSLSGNEIYIYIFHSRPISSGFTIRGDSGPKKGIFACVYCYYCAIVVSSVSFQPKTLTRTSKWTKPGTRKRWS